MPIDYKKYHPDLSKKIRPDILARAGNKCEQCGVRNHSVGYRNEDGYFIGTGGNILHDLAGDGLDYPSLELLPYKTAKEFADMCNELGDEKYIVIVLTIAHLDHNTFNNDYNNLKALCQRCNLRLDNEFHIKNRKQSSNKKKGLQELF